MSDPSTARRVVRVDGVELTHAEAEVRRGRRRDEETCQGRIIQLGERFTQEDGAVVVRWEGDRWHDLVECEKCGYTFALATSAQRPG